MSVPLMKLASLTVKMAGKPIANRIKQQAKSNEGFRKWCIRGGQSVNTWTSKLNVRLSGNKVKEIKPLNEEAAVARGADFLGEGIIYFISATMIIIEVSRSTYYSNKKERAKQESRRKRQEELDNTFNTLQSEIEELQKVSGISGGKSSRGLRWRDIKPELDSLQAQIDNALAVEERMKDLLVNSMNQIREDLAELKSEISGDGNENSSDLSLQEMNPPSSFSSWISSWFYGSSK